MTRSRNTSVSSKVGLAVSPNLYSLHEVEEVTSPTIDFAPALARRQTVASVTRHRAGLLEHELSSFSNLKIGDITSKQPVAPSMGRRVSLPENAL
jgi:hypothetical protein